MIPGPCGICGKSPAAGFASSWTPGGGEVWYCHGDDDETPTCYERLGWPPRLGEVDPLDAVVDRLLGKDDTPNPST